MLESNSDKVRGWARVSPQSAWRPNDWMSVGTCWISYLRPLIDLFHDRQRFIYASTIRANDTKMSGLYMYRKIVRKGNNNNQRERDKVIRLDFFELATLLGAYFRREARSSAKVCFVSSLQIVQLSAP